MTIRVAPTLELMATVYALSKDGGNRSARFLGYVDAAKHGAPISGYNPMTSKPVLATIEALIALGAERRMHDIANDVARTLGFIRDIEMYLTVATPGMWTDRLGTEVHHRCVAEDARDVLWWCDDTPTSDGFDAEVVAQAVRVISAARFGTPITLAGAVEREGAAGAMSGARGRIDDRAAEALTILGDDTSLASMVGFLYGDASATAMGFTPLGLDEGVGRAHAIALARLRGLHA